MASQASWGPKKTAPASRAARRVAPTLWAAISSGGWGSWHGVSPRRPRVTRAYRPAKVTSSPAHSRFITASDSSSLGTRSLRASPTVSSSASR